MARKSSSVGRAYPALQVLIGTGVLGVSGLMVLVAVAAVLGAADYAVFGAFWSALFFVVAILFGGQQETTRAVTTGRAGATRLWVFAAVLALIGVLGVLGTSLLWADSAFGDDPLLLVVLVAVGCAGFAFNGVLAGLLAGTAHWKAYALLLGVEGAFRLVLVLLALVAFPGVQALGWAVVVAYPAASLCIGVPMWRHLRPHFRIEESLRTLSVRTAQTMAGAAAMATLVNGFPLLMATSSRGASPEDLGALTLAVMVTRAPLLVPLMAMQSFLITVYANGSPWGTIARLVGATLAAAGVLAGLAAVIGPPVFEWTFGADFAVDAHVLFLLVLSSGGLGAMCMVSPAIIVRGDQAANAIAWLLAAAVTVFTLALAPGGIEMRAPVSLILGPAAGLMWQVVTLTRTSRQAGARG